MSRAARWRSAGGRVGLRLAGLLLLAGAAVLPSGAPAAAPEAGEGALTALGRSLGGLRVLAVDALFLRAEALRRAGRVEELPAIYQTLLDLDPGNTDALEVLAGELVDQVLPAARSVEERHAWWREAWSLLERGRARNPGAPALAVRMADLLLRVAEEQPGLAPRVERDLPGGAAEREDRGLLLLLAAARDTGHLPRAGRLHLLRLARWSPLLAARALERGDRERAAVRLAAGEELLALHPEALAVMQEVREGEPAGEVPSSLPLAVVLRRSVEAVARTARARAEPSRREEAARALAGYVEAAGPTELARLLERLLPPEPPTPR